jgi:phosphatidate cytidylyltransferase
MTCGRKFIRRPFVNLSPNKTWEGFIGATIVTVIVSWYLSKAMASFPWLVCPTNHISFLPTKLACELDPVFHAHDYSFPSQIFEVLPIFIVKLIPGIVDMCSSTSTEGTIITACISGESTHIHHHFEFIARGIYPIQIHAVVLGMFASLVAPFGGYFASGIKRAYAIKDFDSIIPGHGGSSRYSAMLVAYTHFLSKISNTHLSLSLSPPPVIPSITRCKWCYHCDTMEL